MTADDAREATTPRGLAPLPEPVPGRGGGAMPTARVVETETTVETAPRGGSPLTSRAPGRGVDAAGARCLTTAASEGPLPPGGSIDSREARYAEALRQVDNDVLERTNFGRLTATYEDSARAVMAVADAERAKDAATIANLERESAGWQDAHGRARAEAEVLRDESEWWRRHALLSLGRIVSLGDEEIKTPAEYRAIAEGLIDQDREARIAELEAALQRSRDAHQGAEERLRAVAALAKVQARSCQAQFRADHARNWLDVLAIIEPALAPATSPAEQEGDRG